MSFLSNLFGKSKKALPDSLSPSTPAEKPLSEPARGGTTLRKREETAPEKKTGPELKALEMAERQSWEVKTLPVWKPGDEILGLYRVEDVIETGGMGRVYIAHHKSWNIKLAIKSPNEMMLSDRNNFARVLREANSWTELGLHPNIAYCYYVRSIEDVPHIFVEYVDGGNLRQWIAEGKCIDYRVSLDLAIQFCHGMEHAHSKGMIHRDIKPENVLMTKDGILKITDFGLVRTGAVIASEKSKTSQAPVSAKGTTRLGDVMGTEGFMAPEQFTDAAGVDERADIFSFGVCLYEMFCGAKPYDIAIGERKDAPDPVRLSRDEKFPPALSEVLTKCVQWERDKRYGSFGEIREKLCEIYHDLFNQESPYAELELVDLEADSLNNRGVSYFELDRKEDALSCWDQAISLNQTHLEATYNQGLILWRDGKIADDEVLKRLENCGGNPSADQQKLAEFKAYIHAERPDFDAARKVLKGFPSRFEDLFLGLDISMEASVRTLQGHTNGVTSVAVSPDGRHIVSGSYDKTLRVWDLGTGRCLNTLQGHTESVDSVAVSPDGRQIVSGSNDKTLRVWALETGSCLNTLQGHTHVVSSVAVSPDGRHIVSGSWDNTLRVWELGTGRCIHTLQGQMNRVSSVAVSPDGRQIVSGGLYDYTLRVWELGTGRCIHTLQGHTGSVYSVAVSPDGRHIVSGGYDSTLRVWELGTGRCIHTLKGHTGHVYSVAVSPDGRHIVSGGYDSTLRVWELGTGRCLNTLQGHTDGIRSVAVSPDGRHIVSGNNDSTLRVWRIYFDSACAADLQVSLLKGFTERKRQKGELDEAVGKAEGFYEKRDYNHSFSILFEIWKANKFSEIEPIRDLYSRLLTKGRLSGTHFAFQKSLLDGHTSWVYSVVVSPDGRHIVSGSYDKTLRVWELGTDRCLTTLQGHINHVHSVAVSPDGRHIVSGSYDHTLRVWELGTDRCIHTLQGHMNRVSSVAVSPDDRHIVSGSEDTTLRVWDLGTGMCLTTLEGHTDGVSSVAVSPDGRHIVSGSDDNTLRVWDLGTGMCLTTLQGHTDRVTSVAVIPDGRHIVSGSYDTTLRVWDPGTGRCIHTLQEHTDRVHSVAVIPDGRHIVSGSYDNTLRVWDLGTGMCLTTLQGHTHWVTSVAVSPDGRHIVSGSRDKTLRVWEFTWDLEFPDPVDWDEGVRPYLEIFLTLRKGKWGEEDFKLLIDELASKRGYGWVRPEGIRKELEKMSREYSDSPRLP
jgi:WD40 repeat protein/serine/threonine protein kinase